ncbi:hypothetical protein CDL12_09881 [Handroanthus impetiginosus]|uniref:BHLH domain-containing protein n=1 Tax=Handroanthus impetiginosus TaxID=429701 RepID=A0A2G9HIV6_9LAMI|nr:hypothetical protein CDL12_09881 [Handroanthus impetiginosus]
MDTCLPDWNTEVGVEFPVPNQRKSLGLDNELVELLWQNGEVVLHSQNHRKQGYDPSKPRQVHKNNDPTISRANENPTNLLQDDETVSWINYPIDESFEKEFCSNFLSEISSSTPLEPVKNSEKVPKFSASQVNQDFASVPLPPPRFDAFDQHQNLPVKRQAFPQTTQGEVHECSMRTIGSSHCASNQVVNDVDMSWESSRTLEENYAQKVSPQYESTERETHGQAITSSSGGSGSSIWKTSSQSNDTNRHKRKSRDMEESECRSDATELESAAANKSSQKSGTTRRSRVAEVHNLSERRRRDRINEKMRALQELIPHSNKSDKASMLDEAIEYMKSLQFQLQLMWMGSGMAPMMLPGMQHYMSRVGMGIGSPMLPAIQNLMRLSRLPLVDQVSPNPNQTQIGQGPVLGPVNYQNQMQNSSFPEQYANYMGFHSMPNTSQPINMFNFGPHSSQQNQESVPPGNGSGST